MNGLKAQAEVVDILPRAKQQPAGLIACYGYERLLNCKMIFQLLYWAYQIFSGGRRSDRTDNANREQILPHLR